MSVKEANGGEAGGGPDGDGNGIFTRFPRNFWIVNALELFERGAYYGTMAILAVHIHDNLGYTAAETGFFLAVLMTLLYFVPLVAAALAVKMGYRRTLIGAFLLMIAGYTTFGAVDAFALILFSILMLGVGAGTFKPIISASIARMTGSEQRNQAYAIYYWMINLGAFIVPLTFAMLKIAGTFDPEENSEYVFFGSTALIGINLLITFLVLEDPAPPNPDKEVTEALRNLVDVLSDRVFTVLLLIYAGFWFMFAMNQSYLPLYMVHFLQMPDWFSVFLLATFNPVTIVAAGPFLSKVVRGRDPLHLMITGISIFCIGLLMVGLTMSPILFIAGIVIFSIGEFITHPNFISYVSQIAPEDRVAIYMGYAFIPTGIGYVLGSYVGGILFGSVAETWEMPKLFWALVVSVGLMTIACLVLYDRRVAVREAVGVAPATGDGGEEIRPPDVETVEVMAECPACGTALEGADLCPSCGAAAADPPTGKGGPGKRAWLPFGGLSIDHVAILAIVMIPVILLAAASGGTNTYFEEDDGEGGGHAGTSGELSNITYDKSGHLTEGESHGYTYDTGGDVHRAMFTLTWTDEADETLMENDGDTFTLSVTSPGNETKSDSETNEHGSEGKIVIEFSLPVDLGIQGGWNVTVTLEDAGEQWILGAGVVGLTDDSNDYTLIVEMEYYP